MGSKKGVLWKSVLVISSEVVAAPLNHRWKYSNLNISSSDIFQQLRNAWNNEHPNHNSKHAILSECRQNKIDEGQVNTKYGQFKPITWSISYKVVKQTANAFRLSQNQGFVTQF